jgi:hypothetical protein
MAVAVIGVAVVAGGGDDDAAPATTTVPAQVVTSDPAGVDPDVTTGPDATDSPTTEPATTEAATTDAPTVGEAIPVSIDAPVDAVTVSGFVCDFSQPFTLAVDTPEAGVDGTASFTPEGGPESGTWSIVYTGEGLLLEWVGPYTVTGVGTDSPVVEVGAATSGVGTQDGVTLALPDVTGGGDTLQFTADPSAPC